MVRSIVYGAPAKLWLICALLLGLGACGGGDGAPPRLVSINVTPHQTDIAKGLSQQFTATATYSDNKTASLSGTAVSWTSQTPTVASINLSTGLVTALTVGSTVITAAVPSGAASGSATLIVTPATVKTISITPNPSQVVIGVVATTTQLSASGIYSDGTTQDVTTTAVWTSGNIDIANVGKNTGLASAVSVGSANISATIGSINASVPLTVVTNAWALTRNLSDSRAEHTATLLLNGNVLVTGGYDTAAVGGSASSKAEIYSTSAATWAPTGSMISAHESHTATLLSSGMILVAGGGASDSNPSSNCETYDPATGVWTSAGSMAAARTFHTATLLPNGTVMVTGGTGVAASALSSAEIFDPATGTWTTIASMAMERVSHTATLLANGKVLVMGGYNDNGKIVTSELFDPATGAWSMTGGLTTARSNHTAVLLKNGNVLVTGGLSSSALPTDSTEIYDPTTGTWGAGGSLSTARWLHTMTLLSDGTVLVAGGNPAGVNIPISSSELFDPTSTTWTLTGSLNVARKNATATLLSNGIVLTTAGLGPPPDSMSTNPLLNSAELYDPAIAK